jgi:hypothetical protein
LQSRADGADLRAMRNLHRSRPSVEETFTNMPRGDVAQKIAPHAIGIVENAFSEIPIGDAAKHAMPEANRGHSRDKKRVPTDLRPSTTWRLRFRHCRASEARRKRRQRQVSQTAGSVSSMKPCKPLTMDA